MAATATYESDKPKDVWGGLRVRTATILFDSSYPTGGEALTAQMFGLGQIEELIPLPHASRHAVWVPGTSKLILQSAVGTEVDDESDQSAISIRALVLGT